MPVSHPRSPITPPASDGAGWMLIAAFAEKSNFILEHSRRFHKEVQIFQITSGGGIDKLAIDEAPFTNMFTLNGRLRDSQSPCSSSSLFSVYIHFPRFVYGAGICRNLLFISMPLANHREGNISSYGMDVSSIDALLMILGHRMDDGGEC